MSSTLNPIVDSIYDLCIELYNKLQQSDDIVYSAHSLFIAFSLLYLGSGGETKRQLEKVFGFERIESFESELRSLLQACAVKPESPSQYEMTNSIWTDKRFNLNPAFVGKVSEMMCRLESVDFQNSPDEAVHTINEFISSATHNKINDFLKRESISESTVALIINSLYFKSRWQEVFDPLFEGILFEGVGRVKAMSKGLFIRSSVTDDYTSVVIPYADKNYTMTIVMPTSDETSLSATFIKDVMINTMKKEPTNIKLTMPQFNMRSQLSLKEVLMRMGVVDTFTSNADFQQIGDKDIYVSDVRQEAIINVNEAGTEAAAVTGIFIACLSLIYYDGEITINKPFYFVLSDERLTPLFFGKVTHPISIDQE